MSSDDDLLPDGTWIEFLGPWENGDPPVGARGRIAYFAPKEGGYLLTTEGGGSGYFEPASVRALSEEVAPAPIDESVWVQPAPPVPPSMDWEVRVGGCFGTLHGTFAALDQALAEGREVAARLHRELVWVSDDYRQIAGRFRP